MNRSRRQALELRTGRAWVTRVTELPPEGGPSSSAKTYISLGITLAGLRAAVARLPPDNLPLAVLRRSHADLDRTLASAVALAFAADARGAPTPAGIVSWAAEGLARSEERERAIFAAMDCGPLSVDATPVRGVVA